MSDDFDEVESENEVDDEVHSNLISAVTQLEGKQRVKLSVRKEPTVQVSEFHLVKSGTGDRDAVAVHELAQVLGKRTSHIAISDTIKLAKGKTLPKPLEKVEADKIDRIVRYGNIKKELSRWNAVVESNRSSENLTFPLDHASIRLQTSREIFKKFKAQTPLEIEMEKALNNGVTPTEEEEPKVSEFPLTLQELVQRRKDLARLRAQQSYREMKAGRQHKIKSKQFHRVLRKEKIKQQLKEFEVLKNTNPELALQQLAELDRGRAEERATLRHRSTGKWAQGRAIRAKYDVESRKALAQQLTISRDLTQKVRRDDSSDDDDADVPVKLPNTSNNPWVGPVATESEVSEFLSEYQKYREHQNKLKLSAEQEQQPQLSDNSDLEDTVTLDEADAEKAPVEISKTILTVHPKIKKSGKNSKDKAKFCAEKDSPEQGSLTGKVAVNVASKTAKPKSSPGSDLKPSGKKAKGKKAKQNGTNKKVDLEKGTGTDKTLTPSLVNPEIQQKDADDKPVASTPETSGKRKRKTKDKLIKNTSDSLSVLSDKKVKNLAKKRLLDKDLDLDKIFANIDEKFKMQLASKMSKLKTKLNIRDGNFKAAGTDDEDEDENEGGSLAFKKHARRPELDEPLNESTNGMGSAEVRPAMAASLVDLPDGRNAIFSATKMQAGDDIDPNKFMAIKPKHLKTHLPDMDVAGDNALDDDDNDHETERQMAITEAFAGDDVVADFLKEKAEFENGLKPKPVNVALPGWGSWDGEVKTKKLKRRKRRPLFNSKLKIPKNGKVVKQKKLLIVKNILCDDLQKKMVDHVPFPFTSVADYEASIRAPIGNTWIPERAHKKLCAPRVTTKIGMIIKPMTEDSLVKTMQLPIENRPGQTQRKNVPKGNKRKR